MQLERLGAWAIEKRSARRVPRSQSRNAAKVLDADGRVNGTGFVAEKPLCPLMGGASQ